VLRGRRGIRQRRCAGFTLVELLLVLAIAGVVTAIVLPAFLRLQRSLAVRAAARDLVALAGRARLEALRVRQPVELRVSEGGVTIVRPQVRQGAGGLESGRSSDPPGSPQEVLQEYEFVRATLCRLEVVVAENSLFGEEESTGPSAGEGLRSRFGEAERPGLPERDGHQAESLAAITFYPDGTSDDAVVGVGRDNDEALASEFYVRLRGITGRARVLRRLSDYEEEFFVDAEDVVAAW